MADLDGIQQKVDLIGEKLSAFQVDVSEARYQDKAEIMGLLHEIKEEIGGVRIEVATALSTMIEKIDKNYVRKDVNEGKDKEHDAKIAELQTSSAAGKAEHVALRTRIDRFAIAGATVAGTVAVFKNDLAALIHLLIP